MEMYDDNRILNYKDWVRRLLRGCPKSIIKNPLKYESLNPSNKHNRRHVCQIISTLTATSNLPNECYCLIHIFN